MAVSQIIYMSDPGPVMNPSTMCTSFNALPPGKPCERFRIYSKVVNGICFDDLTNVRKHLRLDNCSIGVSMMHSVNRAAQPTLEGSSFETVRRNISKAARSSSRRRPAMLQVRQNKICRSTNCGVCKVSLLTESMVPSKARKDSTSQMVSVDIMDLATSLTIATYNCQMNVQQ